MCTFICISVSKAVVTSLFNNFLLWINISFSSSKCIHVCVYISMDIKICACTHFVLFALLLGMLMRLLVLNDFVFFSRIILALKISCLRLLFGKWIMCRECVQFNVYLINLAPRRPGYDSSLHHRYFIWPLANCYDSVSPFFKLPNVWGCVFKPLGRG